MQRLSSGHLRTAVEILRSIGMFLAALVGRAALVVLLVIAVIVAMIASCTAVPAGKDALELRATVLGHVPPPHGTALVSESYKPARFNITGNECAWYTRTFATNDVSAFASAIDQAARAAGYSAPVRPNLASPTINTGSGYSTAAHFEGEDVRVSLAFLDLDTSAGRRFHQEIDVEAWRWAAWIMVFDDDCHD